MCEKRKQIALLGVFVMAVAFSAFADSAELPMPPEVWKDYDPDAGDFKEEIVREETRNGVYYKDSYISAYVNGEEVRVFCRYAVKAGAKNAPGLMNVHGWMGGPGIDMAYVNDGWAVLAHDYSGITNRPDYTRYPEALAHGHMEAHKMGYSLIYTKMPDGSPLTDPKATSHYLWNAVQRRALSYLLAQKEVDPDRIGAKGYSYGGTIMWNLGMDARVKAVVAYFGVGWINYYRDHGVWMYNVPLKEPKKTPGEKLFLSAVAPQAHAPYITAASLWLNGSNDHHGGHERGCETFKLFKPGVPWDFAIQARGHHDTNKLGDDCKLWLEKHVLGEDIFWPARPVSEIKLDAEGVPEFYVTPASPGKIVELTAWYALKNPVSFGRAWRDAELVRTGDTWVAKLPVLNIDDYVFAFANIRYDNNCVVSSDFEAVIPAKLGNAVATDKKSDVISEGTGQWSNVGPVEGVGGIQGFRPLDKHWGTSSKQFSDPKWQAPEGAVLNFQFYCTQPQELMLEANGQFVTDLDITASDDWQSMTIEAGQLKHKAHGTALYKWSEVHMLAIKPKPEADIAKVVFANFKWIAPPAEENKPDARGRIYLTAGMACKVDSFWRVMQGKSVEGKSKISVGGVTYDRGLGLHAPSELVFPLDGKYTTFHVVPGPDDAHHGMIEMKILVDGKEVFATGKVNSRGYQATPLDIPVVGARTLTLIVTDAGDGGGGDHASWAEAYLVKGGKVKRDLVFKSVDGQDVLMDIYYPVESSGERLPVFYYTHGGGWWSGSKELDGQTREIFSRLLERGVVCVSANYRYAGKGTAEFPVNMRDCVVDARDGMRYLKKNESDLGIDASRIVTFGTSAGGHISLMLNYSPPESFVGDPSLAAHGVRPTAGVSWYGPADFTDSDLFVPAGIKASLPPGRFTNRIKTGSPRITYQQADDELKAMMREVSPVRYMTKDAPPILQVHGDSDGTIPLKHGQLLQERAVGLGVPFQLITIKGAGHGFGGDHTPNEERIIQSTVDFVCSHLGRNE
jgi:acetyl esterase/lipase